MKRIHELKHELRTAVVESHITVKKIVIASILVLMLYISSVMMFFGMNFWLWSFAPDLKRSYITMLLPSIMWAGLFLITLAANAIYHFFRYGYFENYFFWFTKKGCLLLFLIGFFDSLTGLTGVYATVHVVQILQSALISTGPIWTFLFALFFYPSSQPKFHPILIVVLILIGGGVTLALLPQVLDKNSPKKYFSPPWTIIYLLATALFPLYNVIQGRFLNDFKGKCSPVTLKLVMLAGETSIQLVLAIAYFPVDFSPFYGTCSSAKESWDNLMGSFRCVSWCKNNAGYMILYVFGFWIRHLVFAFLNTYSPSVGAMTSMLTQPINAFFLLVIPSWNVYGSKKDWRFTLGCFLCLLGAMVLFILWHLIYKPKSVAVPTSDEVDDQAISNYAGSGGDEDRFGEGGVLEKTGEKFSDENAPLAFVNGDYDDSSFVQRNDATPGDTAEVAPSSAPHMKASVRAEKDEQNESDLSERELLERQRE